MIRDLTRRRARERRGATRAEGIRLVEEALAAGLEFHGAAVSPSLESDSRGRQLQRALAANDVPLTAVSDRELAALAETETPQGIIAIIAPPRWTLNHITVRNGMTVLVLDAVQDPGNVGTMIRTAHGLGAAGVIALPGTAELTSPKVIRSTMGAGFRLPTVTATADDFLRWRQEHSVGLWVGAADGIPVTDAVRPPRLALAVGNEGAGVTAALRQDADASVSIPLATEVESLNVAIAAAILLYEVQRG